MGKRCERALSRSVVRITLRGACALAAVATASCASVGVTSLPYSEREAAVADTHRENLTYRLPTTTFVIEADYEVRNCRADAAPDAIIVLREVRVTSSTRADPDPRFWFDTNIRNWSGFAVGLEEAKLELNDGMLESINYSSTGAAQSVIRSTVSLAGAFFGAGGIQREAGDGVCAPGIAQALVEYDRLRALGRLIDAEIREAETRIGQTFATNANMSGLVERREALVELREDIGARISAVRDNQLRFTETFRWTPIAPWQAASGPIGPQSMTFPADTTGLREAGRRFSATEADVDLWLSAMQFEMTLTPERTGALNAAAPTQAFQGLFYREPMRTAAAIKRNDAIIALDDVEVLQFGAIQAVRIEGSAFLSRSRGATWDASGRITSVSASSDAGGAGALDAATAFANMPRDYDAARDQRELEDLERRTNLLRARRELREAEEAEAEVEDEND